MPITEPERPAVNPSRSIGCGRILLALLACLAFAVIGPNVWKYSHAKKYPSANLSSIGSALVKILADSGRSTLGGVLDPQAVQRALKVPTGAKLTSEQFLLATALYTNVFTAILREGRGIADSTQPEPATGVPLRELVNVKILQRLGASYFDIGQDFWGNSYNIYPGPWPASNGLVPFRSYFQTADKDRGPFPEPDALTLTKDKEGNPIVDPDSGAPLVIGFPAPRDKLAYIWSNGANLVSGQAIYSPDQPYDPNHAIDHYDLANNQEYSLLGGGDDVNNWDNGFSWSRFY